MDLIPKPAQLLAASGNLARTVLRQGVADLRPMPHTMIDEGRSRRVHHYRPMPGVPESGDPVLLVTPPGVPPLCYDLRRGCSLVEHLVGRGRRTYLVEYGEVAAPAEHGLVRWVEEIVPEAIRAVGAHAGGRRAHLVGWSLGGILSVLTAAADAELPIASVATLGSPVDLRLVPELAPARPALGVIPSPILQRALGIVRLDDTDYLAQLEAVARLDSRVDDEYRGRRFGRLYHRVLGNGDLAHGAFELPGRTLRLADATVPVLVCGGIDDTIAPALAVRPLVALLTGSPAVEWTEVPGGHLGMLTGRRSRTTTWPALDAWLDRWSSPRTESEAPEPPTDDEVSIRPAAPATRPTDDAPAAIGANPQRTYGSSASRALRKQ